MLTRSALLLVFLAVCVTCQKEVFKPVHLVEYMRHGARTTWSNQLNLSFTMKLNVGNITANGMRMHFVLGSQIRELYKDSIFAEKFDYSDIDVLSSSVPRCIQSLESHLTGMYPLGTGEKLYTSGDFNQKLLIPPFPMKGDPYTNASGSALPYQFRPLPYKVNSNVFDFIFMANMVEACPVSTKKSFEIRDELLRKEATLGEACAQMVKNAGFPASLYNEKEWDINNLALFYDEMTSYRNYFGKFYKNESSGAEITQPIYDELERVANLNFASLYPDDRTRRIFSFASFEKIVNSIDGFINGTEASKFRLLSGHDTGLFAHQMAFNMSSFDCYKDWIKKDSPKPNCHRIPGFASSFLYELAQKSKSTDAKTTSKKEETEPKSDDPADYYVKVILNGQTVTSVLCPKEAQSGNSEYCKWPALKQVMNESLSYNYKYDDFDSYCGNEYLENYKKNTQDFLKNLWIVIVAAVLLVVFGIFSALIVYKRRELERRGSKIHHSYST